MNENLHAFLAGSTARRPGAVALELPGGRTVSYGELDEGSARAAGALRERGVRPGDRVAAQVEKSPAAVLLYLGCLRAGAAYMPLNTQYTAAEVGAFLADARPSLLVCDPRSRAALGPHAAGLAVRTLDGAGEGSFAADVRAAAPSREPAAVGRDELAALVYTSGTTGRSKGAMLTHGNLASNAAALHEAWAFSPRDVLVHALPLYHVHGLMVALHTAFLAGCTVLFHPAFAAAAVVRDLPRATVLMGVPTHYVRLLGEEGLREASRGMRLFVSGSAPLSVATFAAFEEATGHRILERYGMSEAGMIASNPYAGERRPGTVGLPLPGVELRIALEGGAPAAAGEVGVVEVRGPNVSPGYWGRPDREADGFRADGFFVTGDLGRLDADGYLHLVGRARDLVISGGLNVYPAEVELVLDALPGVRESAVIGVPHPDWGEAVVAVVAASAPLDERALLAAARRRLAGFKLPKCVLAVDELPRNAMGKVQKARLRERYRDLFAAPGAPGPAPPAPGAPSSEGPRRGGSS